MRRGFAEPQRLLSLAKHQHQTNSQWLERWFTRTYKLPATDPLFLSRSRAEWELEVYGELLTRRDTLMQDMEESQRPGSQVHGSVVNGLLDQINRISEIFGEERAVLDPVIEQWERDLAEGREPDFSRRPSV